MSSLHADACIFVIFGASGDLTKSKLLPAIFNLAESGHLPEEFAILGVARPRIDQADYRKQMREQVRQAEGEPLEPEKWKRIEDRLYYISGEFNDPALFEQLKKTLADIRARHHIAANYLFYFAVPPDLFGTVADGLAAAGVADEHEGWRRVIVEKPFGYDLASARALNAELRKGLRESQIYRIDHYLGKETVQNIMAFRFANGIFEPIWNRRYVNHVQMTVAEDAGVGKRGAYYDKAGALRDIVQNHMFQVMTLVAMEPPISFGGEDVRDEKVRVLHAVPPLTLDDIKRHVVRGQYERYTKEPNVDPGSRTETFLAMRLFIDNWRWAGVPFYLRTGKRLPRRVTEVVIQFKRAPLMLFRHTPVNSLTPNTLVLRIQPDEGIALCFNAKVPGPFERLETVTMDFGYAEHFKTEPTTGYETLLFDAMIGDQTLFHRMDLVEAGWQVVTPILEDWKNDTRARIPIYAPGTWGPSEADLLIERDEREWRD
jgi:glucose-6-phosphate 1-dehydrogenase